VTERHLACKKPLPLVLKGSYLEQVKEENRGELANPSSPAVKMLVVVLLFMIMR